MVLQVVIIQIDLEHIDHFEASMNKQLKYITKENIIKIEYLSHGQSFYIFYDDESMNT